MFSEALRTPWTDGRRTDAHTIKGFRAQPPGKPVRMRIKMAAEVQTFVKEYVDFLTSLWTLVRINLQTAAEVRTFVKKYVNFLTSFWTGRRFSAILLNRVFVLYVFYHVLRNAPHPADGQTETRTIKGFRAQPPGKPVRMRILSHRAPSSLNMSSYWAIWTNFRQNFIFWIVLDPKFSKFPGCASSILL